MTRSIARLILAGFLITLAPWIAPGSAQSQPDASSADARLRALYTEEWNWRQKELGRGDAASDRFAPVDAASQQARLAYWTKALATLDTIPVDELSAEEKINAQIFRTSLRGLVSDVQYRTYEAPFNSDTFFWTSFTPRQGFATAAAYRSYLARLRDVPRYFDEQITNMRAGLARGYSVPRVSVIGRDQTIEPYVKSDASNPLYAPFAEMPAGIPSADQDAMRAEASTVIRDIVAPAYAKLLTMIRQEYLEKARRTLGASAMPDGEAFYQAQIEKHTTLTLTPQQIHDIGLKEVARIEAEMRATKDKAKFKGTMAEFFRFMRTDPQFYAKTPRELLSYSAYVSKKADDKLDEIIGFLPRRRHGIRPVPDAIAPIYTGGRGGLEACLMNTYNLPARPLYTLASLTLHECTPGHSFQAALALEGPERPAFRRGTSFSGYGEGWGLYVEWLGTVMGIYETPYEDMGRLAYEMWRACRLVIDTGIHQFGWTREQAMSYLRDRAPLAEHEITTEIDRYIAWPGQALAYKLGELQIRRHRREAEEKLGPKFDQRRFHDAILAIGSVPLPVLEQRMAQFIADESAAPKPTKGRYILAAGRRLPYIYAVSLEAALDPANDRTSTAIISRSKVATEALDGRLLGDPANLAVSEDGRTLYVVNHHGAIDNAEFRQHGGRGQIAVLDIDDLLSPRNNGTTNALRRHMDSGGFGALGIVLLPDTLVIANAENHLTEDGGNRITLVDRRTGSLRGTVELALGSPGFPCPDYPVPYVAPHGPPRNLTVRAPSQGFGCFPNPNGLALGRATDGSAYVFSANGGTDDVSVIDVGRALRGDTRAEIGRIPMQVGPWGITATPDRRHIIVANGGSQRDGSAGNTISFIDVDRVRAGVAGAEVARVRVGTDDPAQPTHPLIPSVTPDGRELVVPNVRAGNVSIVNIERALAGHAEAEVARIPLVRSDGQPARPKGSAITADGRYAVISGGPSSPPFSQELGHLYVIDLRSRRVVATVTGVGHEPYALAVVQR